MNRSAMFGGLLSSGVEVIFPLYRIVCSYFVVLFLISVPPHIYVLPSCFCASPDSAVRVGAQGVKGDFGLSGLRHRRVEALTVQGQSLDPCIAWMLSTLNPKLNPFLHRDLCKRLEP